MKEDIFPIAAIEAATNGLETDLTTANQIKMEVAHKSKELGGRQYSDAFRQQRFAELEADTRDHFCEILDRALENAERVIGQEQYWTVDAMLHRSWLTQDSSYPPEDQASKLAEMEAQSFLATIEDAERTGNLAMIWLATLALKRRAYKSDDERDALRRATNNAKYSVQLPEREKAVELIENAKALKQQLVSMRDIVTSCSGDVKLWASKVMEQAQHERHISRFKHITN